MAAAPGISALAQVSGTVPATGRAHPPPGKDHPMRQRTVNFPTSPRIVAQDGSGRYRSVQAALDDVPLNNKDAITILIKNGLYHEKLHLDTSRDFVTLIGEDRWNTILTYDDHPGKLNARGDSINTRNSYSFLIQGNNFRAENITFRNDAGFSAGQAVALEVQGDKAVFRDCRIIGNQDILFLNSEASRQYYLHCYIEGTTDFIFGAATAWFEDCHIHSKKNSHVTAASTPEGHRFGFVFSDCVLTGDTSVHNASLGRPWRPYACVDYIHCYIDRHIRREGWSTWNNTDSYKMSRFSEYKNYGPGADTTARLDWTHQLTDAQAAEVTEKDVFGDWVPDAGPIHVGRLTPEAK
jgi:pectinesterase